MLFRRSLVGGSGSGRSFGSRGQTRAWPAAPALVAVGVVLAAALSAVVGPVTSASASATVPEVQVYPLAMDTVVAGYEQGLINVDLVLHAGESRRLIGQVQSLLETPTSFQSIDDTVDVQCLDSTGVQAAISTWAETSLVPGKVDTLRPALLFTAPNDGLYHCWLRAGSGSTSAFMKVFKGFTYLSVSTADEVGSSWWQNPDCDSPGTLPSCTYLGSGQPGSQVYLFDDGDGPLRRSWAAADNATLASVTANVEVTTCGHTASCGGRRGNSSQSTVSSHLEAVQLNPVGQTCNVTKSSDRTDVIDVIPHHYNIAYGLPSVPVLSTCGGSRRFLVRVFVKWVSGNVVKIDGSNGPVFDGPNGPVSSQAQTDAFAVNSYYAPSTVTVPNVLGLSQSAAQNALAAAHLNVGTVTNVLNGAAPGTVIAQNASARDLAGYATVEPVNSPVNITVSLGPPAPVPASPGDQTTPVGTSVAVSLSASGGAFPKTWAMSGLPPGLSANAAGQIAGAPMATTTPAFTVWATVTDANGKSGTVSFTWNVVTVVPNLYGLTSAQASSALQAVGLVPSPGGTVPTDAADLNGLVATQNPSPGVAVAGTPVSFALGRYVSHQCGPEPC